MGGKNSASYFQQTMQEVLRDHLVFKCERVYIYRRRFNLCGGLRQTFGGNRKCLGSFPTLWNFSETEEMWVVREIDSVVWAYCQRTWVWDKYEYLEAVQKIPEPQNATTLRQFIASCNWVRDSILNFAKIVAPLQRVLKNALAQSMQKVDSQGCGLAGY